MTWEPSNLFELAIVSNQPECNFVFGALCERENYGGQLEGAEDFERMFATENKKPPNRAICPKLAIIDIVNKMTNLKPPGHQSSYDDWEDNDPETIERESVAMLRHLDPEAANVDSFEVVASTSAASNNTTQSLFNQIDWPSNGIFSKKNDKKINKKNETCIFRLKEKKKAEPNKNTSDMAECGSYEHQQKTVNKKQLPSYAAASSIPSYAGVARANQKKANEPQAGPLNCKDEFPPVFMTPKALYKMRRNKNGNTKSQVDKK